MGVDDQSSPIVLSRANGFDLTPGRNIRLTYTLTNH